MSHRQYFAIVQNGGNHYAASRVAGLNFYAAASIASHARSPVPTPAPAVDTPVKRPREDEQAARLHCQRRAAEMSVNQSPAVDTPVKRPREDEQAARVQRQRRAAEISVNQCDERSNQGGDGMQAGKAVRLIGLGAAVHLNGQVGKLVSFDRSSMRWHVQLSGMDVKAIKLENLQLEFEPSGSAVPSSVAFHNDRLLVLAAVTSDAMSFMSASEEVRNDLEIAFEAVKGSHKNLEYAGPAPRGDRQIVMHAVKQSCASYKFASESLRNDRELILQIVERSPWYLQYASPKLRDDRGVLLAAVTRRGSSLRCASNRLKADRELVLKAMEEDRGSLKYASKELQATLKFYLVPGTELRLA